MTRILNNWLVNFRGLAIGRGDVVLHQADIYGMQIQDESDTIVPSDSGTIVSSDNSFEQTPEGILTAIYNSGRERPNFSLVPDLVARAEQVIGLAERAVASLRTFLDPLFLPLPVFAGAAGGMAPGMMGYVLMMSGSSDEVPPPERDLMLQCVPGYRGKVPPEGQKDLIARLDELGPTEEFPSIGVTLADRTSYLFKGGGKVLSDIIDILQDGEDVMITHNFPNKVSFARVIKLSEHVVSIEPMEKGMALGPKTIVLFIKIRDKRRGGVSIYPLSFPAKNLKDLRGTNIVMVKQGVRVRPTYDGEGMLVSFEATMRLRPGLELDVERLVIPASVLEGGTLDGVEQGEGGPPEIAIGLLEGDIEPILAEPSNVIDISGRLGSRAEPPSAEPGSVTRLWPKGIDSLKRGLMVLFGRETKVDSEAVSDDPRITDFERMFRHPDDRARFERLAECSMERAVQLLRNGDPEFFVIVGRRMRNIFNTFMTVGQYAEDLNMLAELFSTPAALAEADSDARVMEALVAVVERDPWILNGLEGTQSEMFRAGMESQIRRHYEDAKRGLKIYRMWRNTYPGTNPDGTVDLNSGLPLFKILKGLFTPLRRGGAADITPQSVPGQAEGTAKERVLQPEPGRAEGTAKEGASQPGPGQAVTAAKTSALPAVDIPSPSSSLTKLARNPTIRPRLQLIFEMADAMEQGGEEAWRRLGSFTMDDGGPISVAVVGYLPIVEEARQAAAGQGIGLIDKFISGTDLDFVIVNGMEAAHISVMDGVSNIGTVMVGFPKGTKGKEGVKLLIDRLEAAGWRAGVGPVGGELAVMAVKTGEPMSLSGDPEEMSITDDRNRAAGPTVVGRRGDLVRLSALFKGVAGGPADIALAPTDPQMRLAGGDQPTEPMKISSEGGRAVADIIKPRSTQFRGILDGPILDKLLKATPDTDEAMGELAGLVYKVIFLQEITIGGGMQGRIDVVANAARQLDKAEGMRLDVSSYEDAHARLLAEAFDSIISASNVPEQRRYATKLTEFLLGSGRDLSDILYAASLFSRKAYLVGDVLGLPVIVPPTKGQIDMVKRFNMAMAEALRGGDIRPLALARANLKEENPLLYRLAEAQLLRNASSPEIKERMNGLLQQAFEFLKADLR